MWKLSESKGFNGQFIHKMSLNFRICITDLPFEVISGNKFNRHFNNGCSRIPAGVSVSQSGFSGGPDQPLLARINAAEFCPNRIL